MPPVGNRSSAYAGAELVSSGWVSGASSDGCGAGASLSGPSEAGLSDGWAAALRVPGARLREADEGLPLPWPRPGRPRVPIGMISASPTVVTPDRAEDAGLGL